MICSHLRLRLRLRLSRLLSLSPATILVVAAVVVVFITPVHDLVFGYWLSNLNLPCLFRLFLCSVGCFLTSFPLACFKHWMMIIDRIIVIDGDDDKMGFPFSLALSSSLFVFKRSVLLCKWPAQHNKYKLVVLFLVKIKFFFWSLRNTQLTNSRTERDAKTNYFDILNRLLI